MARVTVEDCLKNVKNRFELVILAAKRARQLMRGKEAKVEWDNDKPTVVALREIAAGFTDFDHHEVHEEHETLVVQETVIVKAIEVDEKDEDEGDFEVEAEATHHEHDVEHDHHHDSEEAEDRDHE